MGVEVILISGGGIEEDRVLLLLLLLCACVQVCECVCMCVVSELGVVSRLLF